MNQARMNLVRFLAAITFGAAAIVPSAASNASAATTVGEAPASTQSICDVLPLWPGCAVKPKP
jgi:hypothetical protein